RGLSSVRSGRDAGGRYVLAQVRLPECVRDTHDEYHLHPSVLDSALQASLGLVLAEGHEGPKQAALPFALECLQIHGRTPEMAWVVVRERPGQAGGLQKLDIQL